MRQHTRFVDRCHLRGTTQRCVVCQIVVDHEFVYRCGIVRHLIDIADSFINLFNMRVFRNDNRGVRIVDTHTLIVQICTHRGFRCSNSNFRRRSSQIDLTRHNAVKGFDLRNGIVLCTIGILHPHRILQPHALYGLSGEVEIISIIYNVTCRHFLPLFLFIDDIAVVVVDIAVLVLLRHQAAAAGVVLAVCITFCKQTVLCNGELAVCLFERCIDLGIIILPAAVRIRRQFQVVDACLDLKVQRAVEIACRMIACHIGVVICAVEAVIFRRGDLEYQRFTATLCGRICPCQSVCRIFCRCNISGKVPLCQLNAPAGSLCLCHGKCLLFPRLIGVFQIVVVQQIVLVPVPYIFRQLECDNHFGVEDASAVTIICLRLTGNLGTVPENITVVKVFPVVLILLTSFHFVQIFLVSGKALFAFFGLFSSYHVLRF